MWGEKKHKKRRRDEVTHRHACSCWHCTLNLLHSYKEYNTIGYCIFKFLGSYPLTEAIVFHDLIMEIN